MEQQIMQTGITWTELAAVVGPMVVGAYAWAWKLYCDIREASRIEGEKLWAAIKEIKTNEIAHLENRMDLSERRQDIANHRADLVDERMDRMGDAR